MSYLLELRQSDWKIEQEIEDKDTLWLVVEAMLDGVCPVECLISKLTKETEENNLTEDDYWNGILEHRERK